MIDRVPTLPNRKLITPEDGSAAFYATVEFADEPMEEGTLLNKAFGDVAWFVPYTHTKTGKTHALVNADGGNNIRFVASADFADGDTFTVNGANVTAQNSDGSTPAGKFFVAGAVVVGMLNGSVLTFAGGSSIPKSSTVENIVAVSALPSVVDAKTLYLVTG